MNIIHSKNPFFHISIENVFSENELKIILDEIESIQPLFSGPQSTGSAVLQYLNPESHTDIKIKKKNTGIFLDDIKNCENFKIISFIDNTLSQIGRCKKWNIPLFHRMFKNAQWGGELINCYKNNDNYFPHYDTGVFSLIFFIWKSDSKFEGGDLYFPEYEYVHKCKNNHAILFFSKELHGVSPLKIIDEESCRYSIVIFSEIVASNNPS